MATTLGKAPLVELVAELKWVPALTTAQGDGGAPVMIPASLVDPSAAELFFTKFGGAIYQHGFKVVERLMPQGMILPPDQMVYRYRQADTGAPPVLLQIGTNQFSANALPPYTTWDEFRPWVEKGVKALMEVRPEQAPFQVALRYIDAFRKDITEGRDATEFLSSVLGIKLELPKAYLRHAVKDGKVKSAVQFTVPLEGMSMIVKAGDGVAGGEPVAVIDTQVSMSGQVAPKVEGVMEAFDKARKTIHDSFFELVEPIMKNLEPKKQ